LPSSKKGIVIIGNGCAGAECIKALRESGCKERIHLLTDSRWPVSNPMLTTYYLAGKIDFERLFPYGTTREFCLKYGVDAYPESAVVALDAERKVVYSRSGLEFRYGSCLIATGAAPVLPPIEGIGSNRIYTLRTVEDAVRLKKAIAKTPMKALVVGASMVGIKVVDLLYEAGAEICLVDLAPHIFPLAAHPDCARVIEERLERKGIRLRLDARLSKVEETGRGVRAYFEDSTKSEEADLMVICIGVKANIGFVDREQVAVDNGILVDDYMRANMPGLYAAGDAAQGKNLLSGERQIIGLWNNARFQGRTAGRNMAGANEFFPGNIPHNITHFIGMDFVGIGDMDGRAATEKKYDGKRYIQLFWRDGLLTGANFLDSYKESGALKHAVIKGLRQNGPFSRDSLPFVQNRLIQNILLEVERA